MKHNADKHSHRLYLMAIIQTACTILMTVIAIGTLIGRYLGKH